MARTRKATQILNLQKYDVLIEDRGTRSDYFKITQFDGYFYGGRNAFLIAGTNVLTPNSKILVEILNVNGETIYSAPTANFIEGSSRLVQVEIYSDTPIGPGKIIILGNAETYLDGSPIPNEWKDKYNVRWITDVIISPRINNKSPIRFINTPILDVEEKFYPAPATASFSQSVDIEQSAYDLAAIRYNIFQNGYLIKLQNPTSTNVFKSEYINGKLLLSASISGSSEVLNAELPITKIYNSTTAESRGLLITSSVKNTISDAYISSSIANYSASWSPLNNIIVQSSSINIRYDKIVESATTGSQISFAKLRIANLNTLSGEIRKIRVGYKVSTDPGEYIVLGDVLTQVDELLSTDSGSKIVQLGKFNTIKIDDYWYAATMSVTKNETTPTLPSYYTSSSLSTNLQIIQESDVLLDSIRATPAIVNNQFIDGVSYFIGSTNVNQFELFPNSEYTLKFNAFAAKTSSSIELAQSDYVLEVYLVQPETSTARLLERNTRGQLLGSLTLSSAAGVQLFEAQEFNFTPKIVAPSSFGLRFIVYGGFWHIANVSLKVAEEQFFSSDEVTLLIPNVNFSNKLLTFKTEYLDINNNSTTISTISTPVYFTGSGLNLFGGTSASFTATASNVLGGTTNYLPLWKSATELSSSVLYQSAQNIGIGTTIPTSTLQVQGNVSASSYTSSLNNQVGFFGTASWAVTSSRAVTSSFATTASFAVTSSFTTSASFAVSASRAVTSSFATTASFAVTSSFAVSSSLATTASFAVTSSFAISASWAPAVTSIVAGSGLNGGTITSTGTISLDTSSVHFLDGVKKELNTEGVISSSAQQVVSNYTNATDNRVITSTGAGGINAESTLTYDGTVLAISTNGAKYFQGGDDAALYDVNVANTLGVYGVQDSTVGAIKLGSGGQTIYSNTTGVGVGTTNPGTTMHVQGNVSASSYTSSLDNQVGFFGTASRAVSASWAPSTGVTSIVAGSGLSGGTITSTGTISLDTSSVHFLDGVKKELNTEGVISSSNQISSFGTPITISSVGGALLILTSVSTNAVNTTYRYNGGGTDAGQIGTGLFTGYGISAFGIRSQGDLVLGSAGDNVRARIDTSGNFGVGFSGSIVNKLQIQGNVSASSYTSSLNNQVGFLGTASFSNNSNLFNGLSAAVALPYVNRTSGYRYIGSVTPSIGQATPTQNQLQAVPFYVGNPTSFNGIGVNVQVGAASTTVRLGIYADNSGRPGALIVDAGTVSTATTGEKIASITQTLSGSIWLAAVSQVGTPTLAGTNVNTLMGPDIGIDAYDGTPLGVQGYTTSSVAGALPSPWGSTFNLTNGNVPIIFLRVT